MKEGREMLHRIRAALSEIESEEPGMSMEDVKRLRGAKLPPWLFSTVREVLRGYHERERAVSRVRGANSQGVALGQLGRAELPPLVCAEYERLNRIVDGAVEEVYFGCAADVQRVLLEDLIAGRGWNKSVVSGMFGERMYYRLKKQCYLYIAARLGLI